MARALRYRGGGHTAPHSPLPSLLPDLRTRGRLCIFRMEVDSGDANTDAAPTEEAADGSESTKVPFAFIECSNVKRVGSSVFEAMCLICGRTVSRGTLVCYPCTSTSTEQQMLRVRLR